MTISQELARNKTEISAEIKRELNNRISAVEESLNFALTTNEVVCQRLSAVEKKASEAETELETSRVRLRSVEEQLDISNQEKLQDWLVFSGSAIPKLTTEDRPEDAPRLLHRMLWDLMGFHLDSAQVSEVHRDKFQIWVRFTHSFPGSLRDLIFRGKTRLRGTGLFVRESLTEKRQEWFDELVKLRKRKLLNVALTRSGTVLYIESENARAVPINSDEALQSLINRLTTTEGGTSGARQVESRVVTMQGHQDRTPAESFRGREERPIERRSPAPMHRPIQSYYSPPPQRVNNETETERNPNERVQRQPMTPEVLADRDRGRVQQEQRHAHGEQSQQAVRGVLNEAAWPSVEQIELRTEEHTSRGAGLRRRVGSDIRSFCAPDSVRRKLD